MLSFTVPSAPTSSTCLRREPRKKAVLIGISSSPASSADYRFLRGPHRDVDQMKMLLVNTYGYHEENVQVLIDDGVPEHVQPDRRNIIMAIKDLVCDTQKGDKLFFQYCGHTIQILNRSDEKNGLEECLVPLDGEDNIIKGSELRECLVDTLPVGASLIAVFDSCHSASLLDLEHTRCNRVFVPWLSKGKCRSDEIMNSNVRNSMALPVLVSPSVLTRSCTIYQTSRTSPTRIRSRRTSVDSLYSPLPSVRLGPGPPSSPLALATYRSSSVSPIITRSIPEPSLSEEGVASESDRASPAGGNGNLRRPATQSTGIRRLSISRSPVITHRAPIPPPLKLWTTAKENIPPNIDMTMLNCSRSENALRSSPSLKLWCSNPADASPPSALPSSVTLSASPLSAYCQGWCHMSLPTPGRSSQSLSEVADVISLSACKDSEISWENEEGVGMTQVMIQVLNENPHPSLRDLVTRISHTLHGIALKRHLSTSRWRKYQKACHGRHMNRLAAAGLDLFDAEMFQHPQLASQRPLDLDSCWNI